MPYDKALKEYLIADDMPQSEANTCVRHVRHFLLYVADTQSFDQLDKDYESKKKKIHNVIFRKDVYILNRYLASIKSSGLKPNTVYNYVLHFGKWASYICIHQRLLVKGNVNRMVH
jgi:hypothetical protein